MLARLSAGFVAVSLIAAHGCRVPEREPARSPTVATINGAPVPQSAFDSYLAVHFVEEAVEEPIPREDTDRVLSRLFDDFLDETLLVLEADRRGVRVDPSEIAAWLGDQADPDPARESARTEQARRELLARRLLDAWIRAEAKAEPSQDPLDGSADDAAERLMSTLRTRYTVVLHPEALPFRYAPE